MIQRTMQEVADFFGCYVARDECAGEVYAYANRPVLADGCHWQYERTGTVTDCVDVQPLVKDALEHDYHMLVEPHMEDGSECLRVPGRGGMSQTAATSHAGCRAEFRIQRDRVYV